MAFNYPQSTHSGGQWQNHPLTQYTQPHLLGVIPATPAQDLTLSCLQVHTPVRINVQSPIRSPPESGTMVILQMSTKFLIDMLRVPRVSRAYIVDLCSAGKYSKGSKPELKKACE
jgi:hypothetical protein